MDRMTEAYLKFVAARLAWCHRFYGSTHPETVRATLLLADVRDKVNADAERKAA